MSSTAEHDETAQAADRRRQRLAAAFALEETQALRLGTIARVLSIAVVSLWLVVQQPIAEAVYYLALMPGFIILGWLPYELRRRGYAWPWPRYVFPLLDMVLLTYVLLFPNPLVSVEFPPALFLRFGNEIFVFTLLATSIFYYAPRVVLWSGFAAAATWTAGAVWILTRPGVSLFDPAVFDAFATDAERLDYFLRPDIALAANLVGQVITFLIVAGILAMAVSRFRRLAWDHAQAERARSNLARHFSPNMVDELAEIDHPLGASRSQHAAVLFADIVGFTRFAESHTPDQVFALLRDILGLMEARVFHHNGTLDKYLGDGIMATFGTPRANGHEARDALACARGILDDLAGHNLATGEPIRIGIGIHYGPVVLGDVGSARRLEYAVVGDTVNVASRLERLTRDLDTSLVISDDVMAQLDDPGDQGLREGLCQAPSQGVRGRNEPLPIWLLPGTSG